MKSTNASVETSLLRARESCLAHAEDLLDSAKLILESGRAHNVAFHLSIIALEEIGKGGMLLSQAATGRESDAAFLKRRLDDHVWKLQWAIWSVSMRKKIAPEEFEEARTIAKILHSERLASLYVDLASESEFVPRDAISPDRARTIFEFAETRLAL